MKLTIIGIVAGIFRTLVMDSVNLILARTGLLSKIDIEMIGRMAAGWARGRFRYNDPGEMEQVTHGCLLGFVTHHCGRATVIMVS